MDGEGALEPSSASLNTASLSALDATTPLWPASPFRSRGAICRPLLAPASPVQTCSCSAPLEGGRRSRSYSAFYRAPQQPSDEAGHQVRSASGGSYWCTPCAVGCTSSATQALPLASAACSPTGNQRRWGLHLHPALACAFLLRCATQLSQQSPAGTTHFRCRSLWF